MSAQIRARRLSPVELLEARLRQIETHNPKLNAFIRVLGDEALAAAKHAEASGHSGPLHGIPVTIKDSFVMEGLPTTCGSSFYAASHAAHHATAVPLLRAALALPLANPTYPHFPSHYETTNII